MTVGPAEKGAPRFLLPAGGLLFLGFAALRFLQPFTAHIPAFLFLVTALFAVYAGVLFGFTRFPPRAESAGRAVFLVLGFAALFRLALVDLTPTLSDDIYRYLWDGRVQEAGLNPYVHLPSSGELAPLRDENHALINHPGIRTVYPPLSQIVFRAAAEIRPSVVAQKIPFVLFDLATAALLILLLRAVGRPSWWAVAYAWNPLVVIEFAGSGHNDSLMLFFLVLGLYGCLRARPAAAGIAFGAAVLGKLIPVVLIPWMIFQRKRMVALFALALAVGAAPYAAGIFDAVGSVAPAFSGLAAYGRDWHFNAGLYEAFGWLLPSPSLRKGVLAALLLLFAFAWAAAHRDRPLHYAFAVLFALLLSSPVVHPWYVAWLAPFLCFFPLLSVVAWTWMVMFSYVVLIRYGAEGIWGLPGWVGGVEYGVVFALLAVDAGRWIRRRALARRAAAVISRTPRAV